MSDTQNRVNPIVAIAAVSVIILSAVGGGVMTGIIPNSFSKSTEHPAATQAADSAAAPRQMAAPSTTAPLSRITPSAPVRIAAAEMPTLAPSVCADCGKVTTINVVEQAGEGTGLGAVAGGVIGGVLGNQIGRGNGRKIATVAGAAGGAYAGHQAEKHVRTTQRWKVAVRMESGSTRMFSYNHEPSVHVGDYVRVRDGGLMLN
ncbi:MAG: glycine zipper 2TM domain-containing protein [Betaproteobacteria bacterium]|nr:glycine zipper 2TM domain-containing protein [Betaproteobacteria bacterium]